MSSHDEDQSPKDKKKRDFVHLTAGAFGVVGLGAAIWPFVNSMNPAADARALASIEVDVSDLDVGQAKIEMWRGKPVFIRRRTPEEIAEADAVDVTTLRDPQSDDERTQKKEWLVMVGICTHLGCVPSGQKATDLKGDYNGWFCPCHGSHYDTSGRIRKGPAPANLAVPPYEFVSDTVIKIG